MEAALRALGESLVEGATAMASEIVARLGTHLSILWCVGGAGAPSSYSSTNPQLFTTH